jgi:hypothetical protein
MMTKISELGFQLLSYLQRLTPDFAQGFHPGISCGEVNTALEPLDYTLPNDFYELYEWRNGHSDYFHQPISLGMICQFSSINFVAQDKKWEIWDDEPPTYKEQLLLPFIEKDSKYIAIALGRSYCDEAYIVDVSREGETRLEYDSITSMLASAVECFERNAFYPNDEGWLTENPGLTAEILRKHNPKTEAEVLSDVIAGLDIYGLDEESDQDHYSFLISPLLSGLATLRRFRSPEAVDVVRTALARLEHRVSDRAYSAKVYGYGRWLSDVEDL